MCQPGRPLPHGLSQAGSPGLARFPQREVAGGTLLCGRLAPLALLLIRRAIAQLAVARLLVTSKKHVAPRGVGESVVDHIAATNADDLRMPRWPWGTAVDPMTFSSRRFAR